MDSISIIIIDLQFFEDDAHHVLIVSAEPYKVMLENFLSNELNHHGPAHTA
jgi:hypothetical protein